MHPGIIKSLSQEREREWNRQSLQRGLNKRSEPFAPWADVLFVSISCRRVPVASRIIGSTPRPFSRFIYSLSSSLLGRGSRCSRSRVSRRSAPLRHADVNLPLALEQYAAEPRRVITLNHVPPHTSTQHAAHTRRTSTSNVHCPFIYFNNLYFF